MQLMGRHPKTQRRVWSAALVPAGSVWRDSDRWNDGSSWFDDGVATLTWIDSKSWNDNEEWRD